MGTSPPPAPETRSVLTSISLSPLEYSSLIAPDFLEDRPAIAWRLAVDYLAFEVLNLPVLQVGNACPSSFLLK